MGERTSDQDVQQVTIRMPREVHEALKTLSIATGTSINEITLGALRDYLADEGHRQAVDTYFKEARDVYRVALDKLADL